MFLTLQQQNRYDRAVNSTRATMSERIAKLRDSGLTHEEACIAAVRDARAAEGVIKLGGHAAQELHARAVAAAQPSTDATIDVLMKSGLTREEACSRTVTRAHERAIECRAVLLRDAAKSRAGALSDKGSTRLSPASGHQIPDEYTAAEEALYSDAFKRHFANVRDYLGAQGAHEFAVKDVEKARAKRIGPQEDDMTDAEVDRHFNAALRATPAWMRRPLSA